MCGIFGMTDTWTAKLGAAQLYAGPLLRAQRRGRDSWGVGFISTEGRVERIAHVGPGVDPEVWPVAFRHWVIGNTRAEPTTEYVADKTLDDVQPFRVGPVTVAHNGVIANDRELCELYGVPLDQPGASEIDTYRWTACLARHLELEGDADPGRVLDVLENTEGSYAMAVGHESGWLVLANNYRPIWLRQLGNTGIEFSSVSPRDLPLTEQLAQGWVPMPANTALVCWPNGTMSWRPIRGGRDYRHPRALVVASGGLDSTVAAAIEVERRGYRNVDLLHITYGCRAQAREAEAIDRIALYLGVDVHTLDLTELFAAIGGSRLTGTRTDAVAGGEAGAEFAHEWVPARNTIMLAAAAGYAEAHGFTTLALGTNIEEAGAYPDNEAEFIERFGDLLPYVVGPRAPVITIEQPVGVLTKREIVAEGLRVGAPLHLTWSCYEGGAQHCGECGPCFMRRRAFEMVGADDPIEYGLPATAGPDPERELA